MQLTWKDDVLLNLHYGKHRQGVGATSLDHYVKLANEFLLDQLYVNPVPCNACLDCNCVAYGTVHECVRPEPDGRTARVSTVSSLIGIYKPGAYISTFFRRVEFSSARRSDIQYHHDNCLGAQE